LTTLFANKSLPIIFLELLTIDFLFTRLSVHKAMVLKGDFLFLRGILTAWMVPMCNYEHAN